LQAKIQNARLENYAAFRSINKNCSTSSVGGSLKFIPLHRLELCSSAPEAEAVSLPVDSCFKFSFRANKRCAGHGCLCRVFQISLISIWTIPALIYLSAPISCSNWQTLRPA